ncbi:hypothetical protein TW95_gp1838 [Pandoravirus inopinatum]|uniref:Uncharacterized protein n=1 Tax=Pandoravirus inopinatum TaxID=1605721 RepID=A0A0B5JFE2_9VIRU|nr:hypothetical protein TW95_gp1838 [Pandoravirus inopinatum]AJF98572.1 hypothetical protein [Pandoravirus inopinatum]
MTTGTTATAAAPASDPTPAPIVAAPATETLDIVDETLTIAGLCDLLRGLADPDTCVAGTSKANMITLSFSAPDGKAIRQHDTWSPKVKTATLAECLGDHTAVSFSGGTMSARALLAALEPCVETHGQARVCMGGTRAVAGRLPHAVVSIATDGLLFGADSRATAGLIKQKEAVRLAEALVASRRLDLQVIAETASDFMPVQWTETRYWLEGTLVASVHDRLPGITTKEIDMLFKPAGPTKEQAAEGKHGRFVIMTPIAGLTYEALVEAYGPETHHLSKADRLMATAAAANATATVEAKPTAESPAA